MQSTSTKTRKTNHAWSVASHYPVHNRPINEVTVLNNELQHSVGQQFHTFEISANNVTFSFTCESALEAQHIETAIRKIFAKYDINSDIKITKLVPAWYTVREAF